MLLLLLVELAQDVVSKFVDHELAILLGLGEVVVFLASLYQEKLVQVGQ